VPELPEVEAVARRLREWAAGRTIVSAHFTRRQTTRPQSPARLARRLRGKRIADVARRAKNILIDFGGGDRLRIHLGMSGNLWVDDPGNRPDGVRAWLQLEDGREIVFDDPRLFGRMELLDAHAFDRFHASLGVEPLSDAFTPELLFQAAARSRRAAKVFLLDQSVVAGLGNIWAAESLFAARVHPSTPMNQLSRRKLHALYGAIREVLGAAVESAYREYSAPRLTLESEGFGVAVYNRCGQPCPRCGRAVERIRQGGRSTYFCPGCQR
jgi:formamidopyrimidine-DNA glycosylase